MVSAGWSADLHVTESKFTERLFDLWCNVSTWIDLAVRLCGLSVSHLLVLQLFKFRTDRTKS